MMYVTGLISYEHTFYVNHLPKPNAAVPADALFDVFGGAAGNCAAVARKMKEPATILSVVGDDFPGSPYDEHLRKELKVKMDHVKIVRGELTSRQFTAVDRHGHHLAFFHWGASEQLHKLKLPKLKMKDTDVVHIASGDPAFNTRVSTAYRDNIISFDPGYDVALYSGKQLVEMFKNADFLFCNEHELKNIYHKTGYSSVKSLLKHGLVCCVVTKGAKGSEVHTKGNKYKVKPRKTTAVDPTGAGNAYSTAFISAFTKGYDLEACGKIGSIVASHVIEMVGAQTNIPSWNKALQQAKKL